MTRKSMAKPDASGTSEGRADQMREKKEDEKTVTETFQTPSGGPRLDPAAEEFIGNRLKAMYDQVVNEPVPDHLLDLLNQLDEKNSDDG